MSQGVVEKFTVKYEELKGWKLVCAKKCCSARPWFFHSSIVLHEAARTRSTLSFGRCASASTMTF